MERDKKPFVWVGLIVLNIPALIKFFFFMLTVYTAPEDAANMVGDMSKWVEAVAGWPLWMSLSFTLGSLGLFAWYLFGAAKIIKAFSFLFSKEVRNAEFAILADERKLARVRSAEERLSSIRKYGLERFTRQLWAREIRQQEWFWSELKPPETPKTIVEVDARIAAHGKDYVDFRLSQQYRDMFATGFSRDNGAGRINQLASQFNYPALQTRFNQIRRKWQQTEAERDIESASYFPDDASRDVWREALKSYWAFCQVRDELSRAMHSTSMPEAMPISEEYLPQLPLDTEEETQR